MKSYSFIKDKTPAFGIDLGTTNSAIGILKDKVNPEIITLKSGKKTMPSCVSWFGGDNFVVGEESYKHRWKKNTIYSVKKLMGTDKKVVLEYNGEKIEMTPSEVSALILKALCDEIKEEYGEVKDVVITVPAKFNNKELEATMKAGKLAGLNVLNIFREPTSASLCYNIEDKSASNKKSSILVYDLGGGTFDVSLVEVIKNRPIPSLDELYGFEKEEAGTSFRVIKNDGSIYLGGDDIDREAFNHLAKDYPIINSDKVSEDERERIVLLLETLKKSNNKLLTTNLKTSDGEINIQLRDSYISSAVDLIYQKTKYYINNTLTDSDKEDLTSIVLVGGSTKSLRLKENLRKDFPNIVINDMLNPDEAVALGASIQANNLKFKDSGIQLFDILPLGLGIESGGVITKIIPRNSQVPCARTKCFKLTDPTKNYLSVNVYQGNSVIPEECLYLGTLAIDNVEIDYIDDKPVSPNIYVTLKVDFNGVLSVETSINGVTEKCKLVNIFKSEEVNEENDFELDDKVKRKLRRWKRLADSLDDESIKNEFKKLLDNLELGLCSQDEVIDFIDKEINI